MEGPSLIQEEKLLFVICVPNGFKKINTLQTVDIYAFLHPHTHFISVYSTFHFNTLIARYCHYTHVYLFVFSHNLMHSALCVLSLYE